MAMSARQVLAAAGRGTSLQRALYRIVYGINQADYTLDDALLQVIRAVSGGGAPLQPVYTPSPKQPSRKGTAKSKTGGSR